MFIRLSFVIWLLNVVFKNEYILIFMVLLVRDFVSFIEFGLMYFKKCFKSIMILFIDMKLISCVILVVFLVIFLYLMVFYG